MAEMMWPYYANDGWSWLWMSGLMIVFWAAIIVFAVWAVRSLSRGRVAGDDAMATLRRRLAAGEITPEEFEKTKRILLG
jgi:uncharacterized membrane protein